MQLGSEMRKSIHILVLLLTLGGEHKVDCGAKSPGCAAPLMLPDKPFVVVWNHPTARCEAHDIHLNFEKWGIVDNTKDKFIGEQMTLLYTLGHWPKYSGSTAYNGGIPQLGNLAYHLQKVQRDIKTNIPNASFSGLSVIDFESWRPLYMLNFDKLRIYQQKSLELARQKFPSYNSTQLKQEATREFELAARNYMGKTLQEAVQLRPGGSWGYYGYPRCWDKFCNGSTIRINDIMSWIYNTSSGLYPSIYFNLNVASQSRATFIAQKIHETLRVKAKWAPVNAAILPYALNQNGPYNFFTPLDLSYSIREPADMGSSGVVLWGSSSTASAKNECLVLRDYINSTLGPYSLAVSNFFGNCTQQLCQGHGRCVRKDYEAFYQYHLRESGRTDCLIPKEKLASKKKYKKFLSKSSENVQKEVKMGKSLIFSSEKQAWLTKSRKKLSPLTKFFDKLKLRASALKANKKRDMWHVSTLGHEEDAFEYFDESIDSGCNVESDVPLENEETEFDFPPLTKPDDPDELPTYDFDDYVCKCFAGWSGPHCENHDED